MRYVEWVDCLKRGSLSVSVFVMCECGTCTKETKNERASCKLGSLVLYCGLFTLVRNLCSLTLSLYWHMLTMPKSASMVHSHTRTTLDSVYKLKSYEFEFQSIFFCSFSVGLFVCYNTTLFLLRPFLSLSDCHCQLRHSCLKTRPLPISIIIFAFRGQKNCVA